MTRALHKNVGVATPTYLACGLGGQATTELLVTEGVGFAGHGGKGGGGGRKADDGGHGVTRKAGGLGHALQS